MLKYQILKTVLFFIVFEHFKAMNTEATRDFCLTCDNEIVEKILKKHDLSCTAHEEIPKDSRASFFKTFSLLLNLPEEQLLTAVRNRRRDPSFVNLQKLEYGDNMVRHLRDIQRFSNLAWISCLAEEYKREIIVVCDFYSLNFAHDGKNVLIFKPSQFLQDVDPIGCLLFGLNSYHPITYSESLENLCTNLNYNRIFYRSLTNHENNEDETENFQSDDRAIQFVESRGSEELNLDDLGNPAENSLLSNERVPVLAGPIDSIRLHEFLDQNFERSMEQSISAESLTSTVKLNLNDSVIDRNSLIYKNTHDIDGLFGIFEASDYKNVIKCPIKFAVFPGIVDARTSKNIVKLAPPRDGYSFTNIKFGVIELPLGTIDLIVVVDSNRTINAKKMISIAEQSAELARSLPCTSDGIHIQSCQSRALQRSHRGNMPASIASRTKKEYEKYSSLVANCYVHHFITSLNNCLQNIRIHADLKIFFKCVGSKSSTFSEKAENCLDVLRTFEEAIEFSKIKTENIWVDYCITASAECSTEPVKHFKNIYYF